MKVANAVSPAEWLKARRALLKKEKELTQLREETAAARRALPWVEVEKEYYFEGPQGPQKLADLFAGRDQLIIYHFMFGPGWVEGCPSCSYLMDHVDGALPHLNARGVTFAAVSRAPWAELAPFKKRMGWKFPWVSSFGGDFNNDFHVSSTAAEREAGKITYNFAESPAPPVEELPGASVFIKDEEGTVFHTYSTYARGLDPVVGTYQWLDLTPKGRDEESLAFPMAWVRHHDKYGTGYSIDPLANYEPPKGSVCRAGA
ncbi:MAG TPA: thioredoxin family protein [Planctomycetia bacterium]|nr:thioredoxin family protein [Planctomycetia bacterium]